MRLFVALEPDPKVIANLTELVRRLAPMAPVRWVHPRNMHVTLKYVGEWDESRLDVVVDALSHVRINQRLKVSLAGLEFFPHGPSPRVFWVTAENTLPIRQLASSVDARLSRLGIPPEVRPFMPHLTLGRLPGQVDLTELHEAIEELPSRDFGNLEPEAFVLYGSTSTPSGTSYNKIKEFRYLLSDTKKIKHEYALGY